MMGAAGYSEYDYWSDDVGDDDISVLLSEQGEEDDNTVTKPDRAKVEIPQVTAWLVAQGRHTDNDGIEQSMAETRRRSMEDMLNEGKKKTLRVGRMMDKTKVAEPIIAQ